VGAQLRKQYGRDIFKEASDEVRKEASIQSE